ncbi:MAG: DUF58 domain-containing protein [Candidatus Aegiribacteria sp.]|nr:DUF58 domain-containing protein [Candidatus Aegiribacteria sp.]MBD3294369.1 DUF58 domain-containing protein [Candidatus Fermentibacteria bacterium]
MEKVHSLFKRVKRIEIRTRKLVAQLVGGDYSSIFRGHGMEFSDLRPYVEGDDPKTIDWNVYARTRSPFVKVFTEERELMVLLLVDLSGSLRFGSINLTKAERVAEVAAVLALSASESNDRVGMLTFSDIVHNYVPPDKGRKHALGLVRKILQVPDRRAHADLDNALSYLGRILKRRALVFIISDFAFPSGSRLLRPAVQKHDVVGIHVFDPRELHLPKMGRVRFMDPETGREKVVNTNSSRWRKKFTENVRQVHRAREELCRKNRLDLVSISTSDNLILPLRRFFEMRKRRRRR